MSIRLVNDGIYCIFIFNSGETIIIKNNALMFDLIINYQ